MAASLGGLLLDDGVKLGEEAVEKGGIPGVNLSTAPIDDNTRLLLQVAVGLLGVVGVSIGECSQSFFVHCLGQFGTECHHEMGAVVMIGWVLLVQGVLGWCQFCHCQSQFYPQSRDVHKLCV